MMVLLGEFLLVFVLLTVVVLRLRLLRTWLVLDPVELARREPILKLSRTQLATMLSSHRAPQKPQDIYLQLAMALREPNPLRRAAECNEALLELEAGLVPSDETGGLLRLLLLGTLLFLVWGITQQTLQTNVALSVLALGGGGALVLSTSARESRTVIKVWREGVDRWVAQGLQQWGDGPSRKVDGRRRSV